MKRHTVSARPNWEALHKSSLGLPADIATDELCWNETAVYELHPVEAKMLKDATAAVDEMVEYTLEKLVKDNLWDRVGITNPAWQAYIAAAWHRGDFALMRRYDFALDITGTPRLHDINSDGVALVPETAALQQDRVLELARSDSRFADADQVNALPDALVDRFADILRQITSNDAANSERVMWFAAPGDDAYCHASNVVLENCAARAGWKTARVNMEDMHYEEDENGKRHFVVAETHALAGAKIDTVYLNYPMDFLVQDGAVMADVLLDDKTALIEPPTSLVINDKRFLALLHEEFPHSPYLLPTYDSPDHLAGHAYVEKPANGMKGNSVRIYKADGTQLADSSANSSATLGQDMIYQAYIDQDRFGDKTHTVSAFSVAGYGPAAIAIREEEGRVIGERAKFVPHLVL